MITGAACLSHTPLLQGARAADDVEKRFYGAVTTASEQVKSWRPDAAIVFFPDHFNGFFYNLLPAFCVGMAANSLGDFSTIPGKVDVPEELAASLAAYCLTSGIDVAQSYDMVIDHGLAQPVELLSEAWPLTRIIPIFINCAAPPLPTMARARALGQAVAKWAADRPERFVMIGSGGLSHDPPLPSLAKARERVIAGGAAPHAARLERQFNVFRGSKQFVAGTSTIRALNPEWDRQVLADLAAGNLAFGDDWDDQHITEIAGCGAHEMRTWIAALAALGRPYTMTSHFYEPIEEWITAVAVTTAS